ncbi:unnamed protein product, partial [Iphiclides podalirius]
MSHDHPPVAPAKHQGRHHCHRCHGQLPAPRSPRTATRAAALAQPTVVWTGTHLCRWQEIKKGEWARTIGDDTEPGAAWNPIHPFRRQKPKGGGGGGGRALKRRRKDRSPQR